MVCWYAPHFEDTADISLYKSDYMRVRSVVINNRTCSLTCVPSDLVVASDEAVSDELFFAVAIAVAVVVFRLCRLSFGCVFGRFASGNASSCRVSNISLPFIRP